MDVIFVIARTLLEVISWAIIIRALLSWFMPAGGNPFTKLLFDVTEPLLAPVRALLSRVLPIPIDFSPIVVILLINFMQNLLTRAYYGSL